MNGVVLSILIGSIAINLFVLIIVCLMFTSNIKNTLYISQLHTGMTTILGRVLSVEATTVKIANSFTEFINSTGDMMDKLMMINSPNRMNSIYKTTDGKFTASSLDELIGKIKKSGSETDYFNDEELDKLKKMFEESDDYLDEEEDSDDETFNK